MENNTYPSREEMEKLLEKAKRDLQATLDRMTPEEREQAEIKARKAIEEDEAETNRIMAEAAALMTGSSSKPAPKFCGSCGAPTSGEKFCGNCGAPL